MACKLPGSWTPEAWELSRQLAISLGQIPADIRPQGRLARATVPGKEEEMALKIKAEEGGGIQLDPGTYPVMCMNVSADKLDNAQFGDGAVIRFDLEVRNKLDEDGNPITLDAIANRRLTPKSKLWSWLEAFGVKPQVGFEIDIEQAVGREAFAIVGSRPGKDGTGSFARIESIVPAPNAQNNVAVEDMDISQWWAAIRADGFNTSDGRNKAEELFGKEPKDLNGLQRKQVWEALKE